MLGIHTNLSNDEYHADTSAVSRTGLWEFRNAPIKYWNGYLNPEREVRKDTVDLAFGRAFHTFVLEPHLFEQQYCIQAEFPGVTEKPLKRDLQETHGKELGAKLFEENKQLDLQEKNHRDKAVSDFFANAAGKVILTPNQMNKLRQMRQSVLNHPQASKLIVGGKIEHSFFWDDPHTGVRCKTRPDILFDNMTVDLKTCKDADERSFIKSVAAYGYHWQSAMNREGVYHTGGNDIKTHTFICVEKEWPYLVGVYYLHHSALDSALVMLKNTLNDFKQCKETNVWPGYATKEISLPSWAE